MLKLYSHELSGNCYKARLLLSLLELEYEIIPVNLGGGEHKSPEFLKLNPFGQVPVIIDGDAIVSDSQAILVYLARRYGGEDWLPTTSEEMSQVVRWLSVAANDIQNSIAAIRKHFLLDAPIDLKSAQKKADCFLQLIDTYLSQRSWLECDRPTIADIACYPYIVLAPDGKISLTEYPNIMAWSDRIKRLPGYVSI
jgi:glutathione S-transferase